MKLFDELQGGWRDGWRELRDYWENRWTAEEKDQIWMTLLIVVAIFFAGVAVGWVLRTVVE